ncbi:MAG TPA: type I pullulanase [Bacteroidaceae bacterium]|nr:type I pullulanase [Bacteroidaceae bacterium]
MNKAMIGALCTTATLAISCQQTGKTYASYELYPVAKHLDEMVYTPNKTLFSVWSPTAEEAVVRIYTDGIGGKPIKTIHMKPQADGTWTTNVQEDLLNTFYTFEVKVQDKWLGESAGINAKAVGVNGKRGAIIDFANTNPTGWDKDKRPALKNISDVILYEMHHRDFSIDSSSGIQHKGKFLALSERGTKNPEMESTGLDHLVDLGITHVHLLPSFDYGSIDETKLNEAKYNWGYDPVNYNVPEGGYSTAPYTPTTRIKEFKQMVQAMHKAGLRVVLDVVYNHTFSAPYSAFDRTSPGYFYRHLADSTHTYSNASGCGNETASELPMMRKYMIESIKYWISEYHIDGFRFDLMGIHDLETMRQIRQAINEIDPSIIMYGEGWAAGTPQLPQKDLAMKANIGQLQGIAAFSDELRDALRGPFNNDHQGGFLAGVTGQEESIKFGIVGGIQHDGIDFSKINYTNKPWAIQPTQMISYISCHDDMCLVDRLKSSIPNLNIPNLIKLDELGQTAVFTSQGIPFIQAGEEMLRDKKGVHNSFESPDSINEIDWSNKNKYHEVYSYYRGLIHMRKAHPAFHMGNADLVRKYLKFLPVDENEVVAFKINGEAVGDSWKEIVVILNGRNKTTRISVPTGIYTTVCANGHIDLKGINKISGEHIDVSPHTAWIGYKK